jgi:hypothetical protein
MNIKEVLGIGIDGNKFRTLYTFIRHTLDAVRTASSASDNFDVGVQFPQDGFNFRIHVRLFGCHWMGTSLFC